MKKIAKMIVTEKDKIITVKKNGGGNNPMGKDKEYPVIPGKLHRGCANGCCYCSGPNVLRKTRGGCNELAAPSKNVIELFEKNAQKLSGNRRCILRALIINS